MDRQNISPNNLQIPGKQNNFLMHLCIGGSDGIVLMLFIITLLACTGMNRSSVINIGLVILLFAGVIMGLSGYLASLIEKKHFKTAREDTAQLEEIRKEKILLDNLGINENLQLLAFEEMKKDRQQWAGLMGVPGPGIPPPSNPSFINGAETGLSYILGGMLPLLPYLFSLTEPVLWFSLIISLAGLVLFGYFKSFYKQTKPLTSVVGALLAGILAGTGAYAVSKIFVFAVYLMPYFY